MIWKIKIKGFVMDSVEFLKEYLYQFLIILVGIGASFIRIANQKKKHFKLKDLFTVFLVGIFSSVFFCWLGYEIAFYFSNSQDFSLAIGGFFAWQGGEWIKQTIDDFINHRIIKKDDFKPFNRRKSDLENEEIDYSKGE